MKAKLVKEGEEKIKFTFNKIVPEGRYRSFEPQNNYNIKLNRDIIGSISEIYNIGSSIREDEGKFQIRFMIYKKDIMEDGNPNCVWRWTTLKKKFDNSEECKDFIIKNAEQIVRQFNFYAIKNNE